MSLHAEIATLRDAFVVEILAAISGAVVNEFRVRSSFADDTMSSTSRPKRMQRHRSRAEIDRLRARIYTLLCEHPTGLRVEQISVELGVSLKDLRLPLVEERQKGHVRASTNTRWAIYVATLGPYPIALARREALKLAGDSERPMETKA